jgi:hypothetical protein
MKNKFKQLLFLICSLTMLNVAAQENAASSEISGKAKQWVADLELSDISVAKKTEALIIEHLTAVRDWHNSHPASTVPEGINPVTGNKLTELDRSIIADSAMPSTVHEQFMNGLRNLLSVTQLETILDRYTIGKVAFTMKGYEAIVPDLTADERSKILSFMKQAREQAIDYKNMKQISAIFEIYKTKSEQLLNNNGRSWRTLYADYTKKIKEEKARKEKQ